jgi:hypothetical protein
MRYLNMLLFLIICTSVKAFTVNTHYLKIEHLSLKSDSDTTVVKKQSLSVGMNVGSDASFFGRSNEKKYPFLTTDIIYNSKPGIFVYGSLWRVFNTVPTVDEFDVGFGYSYRLSKKYNGTISYTKFFFDKNAQIIKSASSNDIDWKNTYDFKFFKSSVTFDYLYGKSDDFFVTLSQSKYFESNWSVFDDKDYITFTPSFNIILGTQNFVQRFSRDHDYFDVPPGLVTAPPATVPPMPNELDYGRANRNFNILNYNIKIPLAYNRAHYTLEASYRYSIPVNVQGFLQTKNQSYYNLTFYYVFY